jgi:chromosome condensin MukBEF ATPase and DNA-binding subunit MukB
MATTVFESQEQTPATPVTEQQPNLNVFADQLSTITNGEGGQKYDTVEKALEALKHSQSFIPTLQSEKTALEEEVTRLREQVAQSTSVQDAIDELTHRKDEQTPVNQPAAALNAEDVAKIITQKLSQDKVDEQSATNTAAVDIALKEKFGTEASAQVVAKAQELGMSPQELGVLAAKNPKMVLQLFGTTAKPVSSTTTSYNFSPNLTEPERVQQPTESLMAGAKHKDVVDFMKKCRAEVYKDFGIEE